MVDNSEHNYCPISCN